MTWHSLRCADLCPYRTTSPLQTRRQIAKIVKPPMPAAQPSSARAATLFASMQARIDCHTRMKLARYATPTGRSSADGKECRRQSQVCSLLPIAPPLLLSARNQLQAHRPFVAFLSVVAVRSVTRRSNHVFDRELHDRRRVAHLSQ